MKKQVFSILLLLFGSIINAQTIDNLYYTKAIFETYYDSLININGIDSMQGTGYNPYKRWLTYWEPRLYPNGDFYNFKQKQLNLLQAWNNGTLKLSGSLELQDWEHIGPKSMPAGNLKWGKGLGRVEFIAFDPNYLTNNTMYCCSAAGGLWKSTNKGSTWFNLGTDKGLPQSGVSSIAFDPDNAQHLFISTGWGEGVNPTTSWAQYSIGIYRSLDGGLNWQYCGLDFAHQIRKIISVKRININGGTSVHLLAPTNEGLYICEDALAQNPVWYELIDGNFYDIEFKADNKNRIFASGTGTTSIFEIDWSTSTFSYSYSLLQNISIINSELQPCTRLSIETTLADPDYLVVALTYYVKICSANNKTNLYRYKLSTNSLQPIGTLNMSFNNEPAIGPERSMGWCLYPEKINNDFFMVYGNTAPIRALNTILCCTTMVENDITSDYFSCEIHVDELYMTFSPDGKDLWVGNDGGVFKTSLEGSGTIYENLKNNWEQKCNGLEISAMHDAAVNEASLKALSGSYDCGSTLFSNLNSNWSSEHKLQGDGFTCFFDWNNQQKMWVSAQDGYVKRSDDNGANFIYKGSNAHWYSYFIQNEINPAVLYMASSSGLRKSVDYGDSWNLCSPLPGITNQSTWAIAVSPINENDVYTSSCGTNPQKLFYSNDKGVTWYDKGTPLANEWLKCIEVNPDVQNHIWVATTYHIYDVDILNENWTDISNGLNVNNAINSIDYDEKTGVLYLSAEIGGIFYLESGAGLWKSLSTNLPNTQLIQLHVNTNTRQIAVASFGRGLWVNNLSCLVNTDPLIISGSNIWNTPKEIIQNVVIEPGATLTITSTIQFSKNIRIIVKPSGTLIIDGGVLTNSCPGNPWGGVEVAGNSNQPQVSMYQGLVVMRNFAKIENAVCGISTCEKTNGTINWSTTGGIIRIEGSTFRNCKKSIEFLSYHPPLYSGGVKSWVRKSNFIIDAGINTISIQPDAFISLYDVQAINIEGCSFKNDAGGDGVHMAGINSVDAQYNVKPDEATTTQCQFENLERGINISNTNLYKVPVIDNCSFIGNRYGISVFGTSGLKLQRNIFEAGSNWSNEQELVGIYLKKCTRYFVSENNFTDLNNSIVVDRSGIKPNEVYGNTITNGEIGIQAQNINGNTVSGLQFKCNNFDGTNIVNFGIAGNIAPMQGYCSDETTPAGNKFNHYNWDILVNSNVMSFSYNHHSAPQEYELQNYTVSKVNAVDCGIGHNSATSCPSKITTGGNDPSTLKTAIAQYQSMLDPKQTLIDAGNTTTLLNTVTSGSAAQAKNAILAVSPYTSDAVLSAAVNRSNPLPPGNLKDVIIANSPVTEPVMNAINSKSLPVGIKRQILAAQTGTSARATLEKEIAGLQTEIGLLQNDLVRAYMQDSTGSGTDSLIVYLQTQNDPSFKTLLCDAYLTENDCNAALTTASQLPDGTQDEQYMKQLYQLKADLCSNGKTYYELSSAQRSLVETIAQSEGDASVQAKAILVLLDNVYIPVVIDELEIPDSLTLSGTLYGGAACGGDPVEGYTLMLTDEYNNPVTTVRPVTTGADGTFRFDYFEMLQLDTAKLFGIATEGGFKVGTLGYKTIGQWIDGGPWTLTLENVSEVWVATMSHNDSLDDAATALDLQGSVFVTGSGRSQAYGYDIVTIKYNAIGKEQWLADYNNHDTLSYDDYAVALDVNSQGQAYVTGYGMDAEGAYDYLTLKYDTAGVLLWSQRYTGGYEDKAVSVVADNTAKSGALVTGSTQDSHDVYSIMTIKYNPDGSVYWQKQYSDPDGFMITPVKALIDATGSFYIAATTYAGKPFFNLLKYDANGSLVWKKDYKYSDSDVLTGITLDVTGQLILCGTSTNTGVNEATTVAYNSSGSLIWEKHLAISGGVPVNAYDVAADQSGNIFQVCGSTTGIKTVCYNPAGGVNWMTDEAYTSGETVEKLKVTPANDKKCVVAAHALVPVGGGQIVKNTKLIMYKNDGTELWKKVSDQWSGISSLAASVNDNVYLAGSTKFYENGIAKNSMTTAKYSQCPSTATLLKPVGTTETIVQSNENLYFELFPNPAKDEVNIKISKPLAGDADVCIYNFQGSLMKCVQLNKAVSQYSLSTKEFANGIYLVQINGTGCTPENRKLIILK